MKQKQIKKIAKSFYRTTMLVLMGVFLAIGIISSPISNALTVQQQIDQLQDENAKYEQKVEKLEDQAVSYQDAIAKLAAKINNIQGKINANIDTQNDLEKRIKKAEIELQEQRSLLGENIKAMYLEGDISTLEMLASSKDLSEFVDKQQYRNAVQDKIKTTVDKINALKDELRIKKTAVDTLIEEQSQQRAELASSRNEQSSLLSYNESQQSAFDQKTEKNQQKIDELIASQLRANDSTDGGYYFLRFPGNVGSFSPGSYPYRNAGFSMQLGPCSDYDSWPDTLDRWGYCTRQCVSYAAWAVEASGRSAPMYYGSANNWIYSARSRGIPVYRTPKPGDIAISTSGYWGHAMYVESVSGNTFNTSEYNTRLDGRLYYRTRTF